MTKAVVSVLLLILLGFHFSVMIIIGEFLVGIMTIVIAIAAYESVKAERFEPIEVALSILYGLRAIFKEAFLPFLVLMLLLIWAIGWLICYAVALYYPQLLGVW